jgi:hypothetical protein
VAAAAWGYERGTVAKPVKARSIRGVEVGRRNTPAYNPGQAWSRWRGVRTFVLKFAPAGGSGIVGVTAIRVVGDKVGGPMTDALAGGTERSDPRARSDAIEQAHVVVGEAHGSLEPGDSLLELKERGVWICGSDRAENGAIPI